PHWHTSFPYTTLFRSLRGLPEIAADAGHMTVMLDGGIRRGTDILKALALGAKFCFVGRPMLYAAVVAGEEGVRRAIGLMREEVDRDMALAGVRSIGEITADLVRRVGGGGGGEGGGRPGRAGGGAGA